MPMSRAQFIAQVLEDAGVSAAGQQASAEDAAIVESRVDRVFADLNARDIAYVVDPNSIPDAWAGSLVEIMVSRVLSAFGGERNRGVEMAAEADLKRMTRPDAAHRKLKIGRLF